MAKKTNNNKKDFLDKLSTMTPKDLNDYIKRNGKPPKPVEMCTIINKSKNKE